VKTTYLLLFKLFVDFTIFILALSFEGASPERTSILVVVFAGLVAWGFIRSHLNLQRPLGYVVDVILIFLLDYQSKYLINHFFHILYVTTLLEAGIVLKRKNSNWVSITVFIIIAAKFVWAFQYGLGATVIAQFLFSLLAIAFLITLINYGKLQQEAKQKSQKLYKKLYDAYCELEELSQQKQLAAILEERNRIARDIHDTLGHRLTSVIMQLEMGKQYLKSNPEKTKQLLENSAEAARKALSETRQAIKALKGIENVGFTGIRQMIEEFSKETGVEINTRFPSISLQPRENSVLYRVIQESITNAVRHGKATKIDIEVKVEGKSLGFRIKDNGYGGEYTEGFGIYSMRKRLEELGGTLRINNKNGFEVIGEFQIGRA